ncbi:MAG: Rab family GTPase [Candidatus Thorarchaeota archaeon]
MVFLGEGAVGKTSLVGRYVYDSFEGDYLATIGTHIHVKSIQIDDTLVKLVIWDIAGQDDFKRLRKAYYQNASGAFFVFDTTRPETLDRLDGWIETLFSVTGKIPLVLVENKIDLPSQISEDRAKEVVEKLGCTYVRTSAKDDQNVEDAFIELTRQILERARERL